MLWQGTIDTLDPEVLVLEVEVILVQVPVSLIDSRLIGDINIPAGTLF